jgi:hypothetical protein
VSLKIITRGYLAGYMHKEAADDETMFESGSYGDLGQRLVERGISAVPSLPGVIADLWKGGANPTTTKGMDASAIDKISHFGKYTNLVNYLIMNPIDQVRKAVGDISTWREQRAYNNSTMGKVDNWTAEHPIATYGTGAAVAAAGAYAIYKSIQNKQKAESEQDIKGLV